MLWFGGIDQRIWDCRRFGRWTRLSRPFERLGTQFCFDRCWLDIGDLMRRFWLVLLFSGREFPSVYWTDPRAVEIKKIYQNWTCFGTYLDADCRIGLVLNVHANGLNVSGVRGLKGSLQKGQLPGCGIGQIDITVSPKIVWEEAPWLKRVIA